MAGISLNRAISADFLQRFVGLASSSQSPTQAIKGGLQGEKALSAGLRIGARTFASALDGLNGAISFVNLSQKSLEELSKITDKLIDVTKRATSISTSSDSRAKLEIEFKRLAGEFRRTVKNATTGDNEFLSKEGLTEIFRTIGLDDKSSKSIAGIFSQFVTSSSDDAFASEKTAGPPIAIPVGAFSVRESDAEYTIQRVSNIEYSGGGISTVNSVIRGDVTTSLNQNAGFHSLATIDTNGSTTALQDGILSRSILRVLDVNEENGYSLIVSRDDLMGGYNPSNYEQIFLIDHRGAVLTQFTDNTSSGANYTSAEMSRDTLSIAYSVDDENEGGSFVFHAEIGSYAQTPSTTMIQSADLGNLSEVKYNAEGSYIAYRSAALSSIELYNVAEHSFDDSIGSLGDITQFDFISAKELVYLDPSDSTTVWKHEITNFTAEEFGTLEEPADIFSVTEDVGYVGVGADSNTLRSYDLYGAAHRTIELTGLDTVSNVSLARNRDNPDGIDIGIAGGISSFGFAEGKYLYRISDNPAHKRPQPLSRVTPTPYDPITYEQRNSIFDESKSLTNRAQAFRTLNDLEALKEQISKNLTALDSARKTLNDSIKLVRAAGNAFLEISEQVTSADDAESLAQKLRTKIRSAGSAALTQAEHLNSLTVAALTNSSDR